ncbi:MAG: hypothetical protein EOM21_17840 [Gammaproteobacteria bacterium]|nr:hypothetical protein [Gammaproteobacteria bacterium]
MTQLTPYQKAWLNEIGYTALDQIKTCDPDLQTITFLDGTIRQKVECWSRVMGYWRPFSCYNAGKKQEHRDRKFFHMPAQLL